MKNLINQFLKFGLVGGIAFFIDYVVLFACTDYFGLYYLISSFISFTVSTVFNYIASIKWVFNVDETNSKKKNFILFITFSVIGLGINQLIMWYGVDQLHIYYMLVKVGATFIVMCFNFVTRKKFLEK